MKHRDWKFDYLAHRQHWACPVKAQNPERVGGDGIVSDLHHRLANSVMNRRRFPLLIHSLFNLVALSHGGHMYDDKYRAIRLLEAERREEFLRQHPRWCAWLNGDGQ